MHTRVRYDKTYLPAKFGKVRVTHELDRRRSALREPWQPEENAAAGRGKKLRSGQPPSIAAISNHQYRTGTVGSNIRYRALRINGCYRPQKQRANGARGERCGCQNQLIFHFCILHSTGFLASLRMSLAGKTPAQLCAFTRFDGFG